MPRPSAVPVVVSDLAQRVHDLLGRDLIGVYLGGSFVMRDFIDATSDYDLLVLIRRPLTLARVAALRRLHEELVRADPDAARLEGDYVPTSWLTAIGTTRPVHHFTHGRLRSGTAFMLSADNLANIRADGIAVVGPPARKVLPPVERDQVRAAAREMLHDRSAPRTQADAADEILGALRSMSAIETGRPTSKATGVRWGLAHLDRKWHVLIRVADAVRRGGRVEGGELLPHVSAFKRSIRALDRAAERSEGRVPRRAMASVGPRGTRQRGP